MGVLPRVFNLQFAKKINTNEYKLHRSNSSQTILYEDSLYNIKRYIKGVGESSPVPLDRLVMFYMEFKVRIVAIFKE